MAAGLGDTGGQWGTLGAQTLPAVVGAAGVPSGVASGEQVGCSHCPQWSGQWGGHTVPGDPSGGCHTVPSSPQWSGQ